MKKLLLFPCLLLALGLVACANQNTPDDEDIKNRRTTKS